MNYFSQNFLRQSFQPYVESKSTIVRFAEYQKHVPTSELYFQSPIRFFLTFKGLLVFLN